MVPILASIKSIFQSQHSLSGGRGRADALCERPSADPCGLAGSGTKQSALRSYSLPELLSKQSSQKKKLKHCSLHHISILCKMSSLKFTIFQNRTVFSLFFSFSFQPIFLLYKSRNCHAAEKKTALQERHELTRNPTGVLPCSTINILYQIAYCSILY